MSVMSCDVMLCYDSVLGVDGYNPSIIQYDQPAGGGATATPEVTSSSSSASASTQPAKPATKAVASAPAAPAAPAKRSNTNSSAPSNLSVEQTIDASIQAIANHRTGGWEGYLITPFTSAHTLHICTHLLTN